MEIEVVNKRSRPYSTLPLDESGLLGHQRDHHREDKMIKPHFQNSGTSQSDPSLSNIQRLRLRLLPAGAIPPLHRSAKHITHFLRFCRLQTHPIPETSRPTLSLHRASPPTSLPLHTHSPHSPGLPWPLMATLNTALTTMDPQPAHTP